MGGRGSGGHNAISIAEHLRGGTFRPHRHGKRLEAPASGRDVTPAERRRVLGGLGDTGRRLAAGLLDEFGDWHAAALVSLRLLAQAADRLAGDLDDAERRRETRAYLALLKSLELDK